jgi:cytochrome c oxidase subunit 4
MADSPEEVKKHLKLYLGIGLTLLVFTFITVFVARPGDMLMPDLVVHALDFGVPGVSAMDIVLGLCIATFKASLVGLIFMHLKEEKALVYKMLVFTTIFVAGMLSLMLLAKFSPLNFAGFWDIESVQSVTQE